jgi:hypothetical protein
VQNVLFERELIRALNVLGMDGTYYSSHLGAPEPPAALGITKQSARQITGAIFSALGQSRVLCLMGALVREMV